MTDINKTFENWKGEMRWERREAPNWLPANTPELLKDPDQPWTIAKAIKWGGVEYLKGDTIASKELLGKNISTIMLKRLLNALHLGWFISRVPLAGRVDD